MGMFIEITTEGKAKSLEPALRAVVDSGDDKIRDYMRGQCVVCGNMRDDIIRPTVIDGVRVDVCWWPAGDEDCHSELRETLRASGVIGNARD